MEQEICLANLREKTEQEVFDYISAHLLLQNEKALAADPTDHKVCAYRTPSGLRCAAGCLIAPSEYKMEFEGDTWNYLVHRGVVPATHLTLINELQSIHDRFPTIRWREELAKVNPKSLASA
jgi:hypothetical protein